MKGETEKPAQVDAGPEAPRKEVAETSQVITLTGPAAELYGALAEAQGAFGAVGRNATGQTGHRKFRYADLEALITATRPVLAEHGLAVLQPLSTDAEGRLVVTTILAHKSGAAMTATITLDSVAQTEKDDVQWCGALSTYWRRFQYRSLLGLADGEDLDEAGAPERARAEGGEKNGAAKNALVDVVLKPTIELSDLHKSYLSGLHARLQEDGTWHARVNKTRLKQMREITWAEVHVPQAESGFQSAASAARPTRGTPSKVK